MKRLVIALVLAVLLLSIPVSADDAVFIGSGTNFTTVLNPPFTEAFTLQGHEIHFNSATRGEGIIKIEWDLYQSDPADAFGEIWDYTLTTNNGDAYTGIIEIYPLESVWPSTNYLTSLEGLWLNHTDNLDVPIGGLTQYHSYGYDQDGKTFFLAFYESIFVNLRGYGAYGVTTSYNGSYGDNPIIGLDVVPRGPNPYNQIKIYVKLADAGQLKASANDVMAGGYGESGAPPSGGEYACVTTDPTSWLGCIINWAIVHIPYLATFLTVISALSIVLLFFANNFILFALLIPAIIFAYRVNIEPDIFLAISKTSVDMIYLAEMVLRFILYIVKIFIPI
jgi:hypothetical protein